MSESISVIQCENGLKMINFLLELAIYMYSHFRDIDLGVHRLYIVYILD